MSIAENCSIRMAVPSDLDAASEVLADAFENYPWTRWSIPEDSFLARLAALQALYLKYALSEGVVLVEEQIDGVIALLPPNVPEPSRECQARVADLHGDRLDVVARANLPPAPEGCWTVETVGVRPERQGAGIGTELVRAGLDVVAASGGVGVALETSLDSNVRLYERVGFDVTATRDRPRPYRALYGDSLVSFLTPTVACEAVEFRFNV